MMSRMTSTPRPPSRSRTTATKSSALVVDRSSRAKSRHMLARGPREPAVAKTVAPNARAAGWRSCRCRSSPRARARARPVKARALKEIGPDGEERFRDGRRRAPAKHRSVQAGTAPLGRRRIPHSRRLRPAHRRGHQCEAGGAGGLDDFACDLEAGKVGGARWRRILAHPLHDVGPVDAGSGHADEDFTGARLGHGPAHGAQVLRVRRVRRSRSRAWSSLEA